MLLATISLAVWLATLAPAVLSQTLCSGAASPRYPLTVASGWRAGVVLSGLSTPRGITIDTRGNLLVIQRNRGLTGHTVDSNGCVTSTKTIIANTALNHAIDVHPSGNRLIASSDDAAWSWDYDPVTMTATNQRLLVTGMRNLYHYTRTVLISKKYPNLFALSVGSDGNIDLPTRQAASGRAQIRVFDYNQLPSTSVVYNNSAYGKVLGYGLRNDVGMAEDRAGNFHSVENSLDDAYRMVNGQRRDIHTNNPAEKVYNLGDPSNPKSLFYGYPDCFSAWASEDFPDGKQVGDWFTQDNSGTYTDAWCNSNAGKPIVLLPPHTAPLDMKFGLGNDTNLYVPMHGSWNRQPPQGYKVVVVPGRYSATGEWSPTVGLAQTKTSWSNLLTNSNEGGCGGQFGASSCFRPVGIVFSLNGENLYVASDTTGEVFMLKRNSGGTVDPPVITTVPTPGPTTAPPTTTSRPPVTTVPSTVQPPGPTQTLWGQCGGQGWQGPTLCPSNSSCKATNEWYSQCVPA